jgi:hypothetical protein
LSMLGSEPLMPSPSHARGGATSNVFEEFRVTNAYIVPNRLGGPRLR